MPKFLERYRDRVTYPRFNFAIDFVLDLALILTINLSVRGFYFLMTYIAMLGPANEIPEQAHSYLPVDVTRWLVTVTDGVSIIAFLVIAISTIVKIARVQIIESFRR